MAKKLDFDKEKNNRNDNAIEEIMQADFPLPKQAEDAKNEAFARIREMAAASENVEGNQVSKSGWIFAISTKIHPDMVI